MQQDLYSKFFAAVAEGHTYTLATLIDNGADVNTRDNHGFTALMFAAVSGFTDTVAMLMEKGADANIKNNNGKTVSELVLDTDHKNTAL